MKASTASSQKRASWLERAAAPADSARPAPLAATLMATRRAAPERAHPMVWKTHRAPGAPQ